MFKSDHSFPEATQWNGDDTEPMGRGGGCSGVYAKRLKAERAEWEARCLRDILTAVDALGWERVQTIMADAKASQ